jgi:hypothetical protein
MPGGRYHPQPLISIPSQTMQIQKNQILHGVSPWSPFGSGSSTRVVTGTIAPGGHSVQTGSGAVVVVVDVVSGGGIGTPMTVVQSIESRVDKAEEKTSTVLVVGHAKLMVVRPGHGSVTAVAGVWNEYTEEGGQESVMGLTVGGNLMVVVVGPLAVISVR